VKELITIAFIKLFMNVLHVAGMYSNFCHFTLIILNRLYKLKLEQERVDIISHWAASDDLRMLSDDWACADYQMLLND